jgi:hypothetical protein
MTAIAKALSQRASFHTFVSESETELARLQAEAASLVDHGNAWGRAVGATVAYLNKLLLQLEPQEQTDMNDSSTDGSGGRVTDTTGDLDNGGLDNEVMRDLSDVNVISLHVK